MRRTGIVLGVVVAVGLAVGVSGSRVLDAQQQPLRRTMLLTTDLVDIEGKEGLVLVVEVPPGAVAGAHTHPGTEFAYVLEGSGILEIEGTPPIPLKAGDAVAIPARKVHDGRNSSTTVPLKLLVFWVLEKDQPRVAPVP